MRFLSALLVASVALAPAPATPTILDDFGILVMAHGGSEDWDQTVLDAVAPLGDEFPTEVAFGMADADRMQLAIDRLIDRGVRRIGVVRLFIDGASFLERTEKILGLRPGAPPETEKQGSPMPGMQMSLFRIERDVTYALSHEGLKLSPEMGIILRDRAAALSRTPESEALVLIAHGAGSEAHNREIERIGAERLILAQHELGFERVIVHALAEDWSDLRAASEAHIRADVEAALADGLTPVVLPMRLSGFGPYAEVLDGLDYRSDGIGLLPHRAVTDWLRRQAHGLHNRFEAPAIATEAGRP